MTEKDLIKQIKQLKDIKPRSEWASLCKSQILNSKLETNSNFQNNEFSKPVSDFGFRISDFLFGLKIQKRLAYSFATLLFICVGLVGFAQYTMPGDLLFPVRKITEKSEATLVGQTKIKQNVANLNNRINDLVKVAQEGKKDNISPAINEVSENAGVLAKNLKDNSIAESDIKEIVASLKVLAAVPGTDAEDIPEVKNLYQTIVENQIADLQELTLTKNQEEILLEVEKLYEEGKYIEALEKILGAEE